MSERQPIVGFSKSSNEVMAFSSVVGFSVITQEEAALKANEKFARNTRKLQSAVLAATVLSPTAMHLYMPDGAPSENVPFQSEQGAISVTPEPTPISSVEIAQAQENSINFGESINYGQLQELVFASNLSEPERQQVLDYAYEVDNASKFIASISLNLPLETADTDVSARFAITQMKDGTSRITGVPMVTSDNSLFDKATGNLLLPGSALFSLNGHLNAITLSEGETLGFIGSTNPNEMFAVTTEGEVITQLTLWDRQNSKPVFASINDLLSGNYSDGNFEALTFYSVPVSGGLNEKAKGPQDTKLDRREFTSAELELAEQTALRLKQHGNELSLSEVNIIKSEPLPGKVIEVAWIILEQPHLEKISIVNNGVDETVEVYIAPFMLKDPSGRLVVADVVMGRAGIGNGTNYYDNGEFTKTNVQYKVKTPEQYMPDLMPDGKPRQHELIIYGSEGAEYLQFESYADQLMYSISDQSQREKVMSNKAFIEKFAQSNIIFFNQLSNGYYQQGSERPLVGVVETIGINRDRS